MKKRFVIVICILGLLLASFVSLAGGFADGDHPITMTVVCDPDPELEEGGTIPDLLFTIRNTGTTDYTLENAMLSGGYEDRTLTLDEDITVLAGGTKEFHLKDVPIADEQLDQEIEYKLSWEESETVRDEETGTVDVVKHPRDTTAHVTIPRFVLPELTVTAKASAERVRAGETFTVVYTIANETKFDMSGLKLYDPEQSMQRIELPSTDLYAGEQRSIEITYTMDKQDMQFAPVIEYVARQREMLTKAETPLTVESIVVELTIAVQQYPATREGVSFAVTVTNVGNRTVTDVRLYDEINTQIDEPFDLAPEQSKVLSFNVPSAISAGMIRVVRFHVRATDCFGTVFTVTDPNQYEAAPYVDSDAVKLYLDVEIQRAYYDETGKLCAAIQFKIRNYSDVTLRSAALYEKQLFGTIKEYGELQNGETYYASDYQLDGVEKLQFGVRAKDPAGSEYSAEEVLLDLSNLRSLIEGDDNPVYVYPYNPYLKELAERIKKPATVALIVVLSVVAVCMIVWIVLFAVERKLKAKLPPAFEEDMENAMRQTKRRMESPLFKDAPTEQFGYRAPIKLRDYGELTEQEAEKRRQEYARKLRENLDRDAKAEPVEKPAPKKAIPEQKPVPERNAEDAAFAQTRIIPIPRVFFFPLTARLPAFET